MFGCWNNFMIMQISGVLTAPAVITNMQMRMQMQHDQQRIYITNAALCPNFSSRRGGVAAQASSTKARPSDLIHPCPAFPVIVKTRDRVRENAREIPR
jgi:hypothetical protein